MEPELALPAKTLFTFGQRNYQYTGTNPQNIATKKSSVTAKPFVDRLYNLFDTPTTDKFYEDIELISWKPVTERIPQWAIESGDVRLVSCDDSSNLSTFLPIVLPLPATVVEKVPSTFVDLPFVVGEHETQDLPIIMHPGTGFPIYTNDCNPEGRAQ